MSKYAGWDDVGNKHGLDDGTLKTLYPAGIIMVRIDGEEFSLVSTVGCEEQNPGTIFVGWGEHLGDVPAEDLVSLKKGYRAYLRTQKWERISNACKSRDGACLNCGSTQHLQAHHLIYDNVFDEDHHMNDLVTLCKDCHSEWHKFIEGQGGIERRTVPV